MKTFLVKCTREVRCSVETLIEAESNIDAIEKVKSNCANLKEVKIFECTLDASTGDVSLQEVKYG